MSTKQRIKYFFILFLPIFLVSFLINVVYSLEVHEFIKVDWLIVILLAIAIDAFLTWRQTRIPKKDGLK
jgi:hypothetical protein